MSEKACTTCGESKPLDAFGSDRRHRDGRQSRCRECHAAYQKRRTVDQRDRYLAQRRAEYQRRKPKAQAYARANREQRRQWARERQQRMTPDELERHRETRRHASAAYLARHPERCKERISQWQRDNREKAVDYVNRRRARQHAVAWEPIDVVTVGERDNWLCGICATPVDPELRYPDQMSRSVDHIVPLATGGPHLKSNVRLAHWICNVRRGAARGEDLGESA